MACTDSSECFNNFYNGVKAIVPAAHLSVNMHITLRHSTPYHEVFCTFYDKGKFENFVRDEKFKEGVLCKKFHVEKCAFTHPAQKKFKGDLPTQTQLENI